MFGGQWDRNSAWCSIDASLDLTSDHHSIYASAVLVVLKLRWIIADMRLGDSLIATTFPVHLPDVPDRSVKMICHCSTANCHLSRASCCRFPQLLPHLSIIIIYPIIVHSVDTTRVIHKACDDATRYKSKSISRRRFHRRLFQSNSFTRLPYGFHNSILHTCVFLLPIFFLQCRNRRQRTRGR